MVYLLSIPEDIEEQVLELLDELRVHVLPRHNGVIDRVHHTLTGHGMSHGGIECIGSSVGVGCLGVRPGASVAGVVVDILIGSVYVTPGAFRGI